MIQNWNIDKTIHVPNAEQDGDGTNEVLFNITLRAFASPSNKIQIARLVSVVAAFYFLGPIMTILVMGGFLIVDIRLDKEIRKIRDDYEAGLISAQNGENSLTWISLTRSVAFSLVYASFLFSPKEFYDLAAVFFISGQIVFLLYQIAGSKKLLMAGLLPPLIAILSTVSYISYAHANMGSLIASLIFIASLFALSSLTFNDRNIAAQNRQRLLTDAKKLKASLEANEAEKNARDMIERISGVGVYQWTFADNKMVWSPGVFKAFGYLEEDGVPSKREFIANLVDEDRETYRKCMSDCRDNGKEFILEFSTNGKDGKIRNVRCHGAPLEKNGKSIGVEGIIIDQTIIKNAYNRLEHTQDLLQLALTQGRSSVLVMKPEEEFLHAYGALDMIGLKPSYGEVLAKNIVLDKLDRENSGQIYEAIDKAKSTGKTQTIEHKIARYDSDDELDVRLSLSYAVNSQTGESQIISFSTDISDEIIRRQELNEAVKEAERLSRVKSEFLANMSHEIRTPLNGIVAITSVLKNSDLPAREKEMLDLVSHSGEALSKILNDILDIARVESGKLEIEKVDFNLYELLDSISALFSARAQEKSLSFSCELPKNIANIFRGDATRIRQIVSNLLSNAIKFTQIGEVRLKVKLNDDDDSNIKNLEIEISDTGIGIKPDDLNRLFNRFEQIDGSITREYGGSGLGLAISNNLAHLMGGELLVQSDHEIGSKFTLKMPLEISRNLDLNNEHSSHENHDSIVGMEPLSVLGVDDNETNRKVLDMILSPMVDLLLCENGQEAVDLFNMRRFDVILMDLQMPVKDGLSAIREIRELEKNNNLARTPIIALSANAMVHHVKEALDAGADMHLAKPYTPQFLVSAIEIVIERNEQGDELNHEVA